MKITNTNPEFNFVGTDILNLKASLGLVVLCPIGHAGDLYVESASGKQTLLKTKLNLFYELHAAQKSGDVDFEFYSKFLWNLAAFLCPK